MNDNHLRHNDEPLIIDEFFSLFFYDYTKLQYIKTCMNVLRTTHKTILSGEGRNFDFPCKA